MKEQGKNLQDQTNEEEIGNLPEKEFRVMIVKMIQNLGNRMEAWIEKIFEELIPENFPTMGKEIVNKVQEAQRAPTRINTKRNTPRHILNKL